MRMTKAKKLVLALIGFSLMMIYLFLSSRREITITLGMFTGSNWDVYNAESYKVIDDAIEKFEKEHPNVITVTCNFSPVQIVVR